MKITIYELLGLIKDGKAPKKIKYNERVYEIDEIQEDYSYFAINRYEYLLDDINTFSRFNYEIEILDEEDEFIDIEEIEIKKIEETSHLEFKEKINDLIKNQKKIINKLKEEGK